MAHENEDRLVTAVEARDTAGIPNWRVRNWSHEGRAIPRGKRGRFNLYSLAQLTELNAQAEFDPRARKWR